MPSNSLDFNQILNITPSGHLQTIHNVIKDTSPSQERQNHHQLQQEFLKCHQSLTGFLMPSNSSDFNQISNETLSEHLQSIHNVIRDTSPSQERQKHHQLQQEFLKCHLSLTGFLMPSNSSDFNQILNITSSGQVRTNDHAKCHQGQQPQSGTS